MLKLRRCGLGAASGAALGYALQLNASLRRLDLGDNPLGPQGGATLANGLVDNDGLLHLSLARTQLGAHGLAALAHMLKVNPTLHSLHCEGNPVESSEGLYRFTEALTHNKALVRALPPSPGVFIVFGALHAGLGDRGSDGRSVGHPPRGARGVRGWR